MHLRYTPIAPNTWSVLKADKKIAEVTVPVSGLPTVRGHSRRPLTLTELHSLTTFAREVRAGLFA